MKTPKKYTAKLSRKDKTKQKKYLRKSQRQSRKSRRQSLRKSRRQHKMNKSQRKKYKKIHRNVSQKRNKTILKGGADKAVEPQAMSGIAEQQMSVTGQSPGGIGKDASSKNVVPSNNEEYHLIIEESYVPSLTNENEIVMIFENQSDMKMILKYYYGEGRDLPTRMERIMYPNGKYTKTIKLKTEDFVPLKWTAVNSDADIKIDWTINKHGGHNQQRYIFKRCDQPISQDIVGNKRPPKKKITTAAAATRVQQEADEEAALPPALGNLMEALGYFDNGELDKATFHAQWTQEQRERERRAAAALADGIQRRATHRDTSKITAEKLGIPEDLEADRVITELLAESQEYKELAKEAVQKLESMKEYLICPITKQDMEEPVVGVDGNSYERAAIQRWLVDTGTSPINGEVWPHKDLIVNRALKRTIDKCKELTEVTSTDTGESAQPAAVIKPEELAANKLQARGKLRLLNMDQWELDRSKSWWHWVDTPERRREDLPCTIDRAAWQLARGRGLDVWTPRDARRSIHHRQPQRVARRRHHRQPQRPGGARDYIQ